MSYFSRELVVLITTCIAATWTQEALFGQEGGSVTLPMADKGDGGVSWMFGTSMTDINQPLVSRSPNSMMTYGGKMKDRVSLAKSNVSLIIKNLQKGDFGFFQCQLTKTKSITVYRLFEVTVTPIPSSLLLASQNLTLKCEEQSMVQTSIEWLSPSGKRLGEEKTLSVINASHQDTGAWTCIVKANGREAHITTTVNVVDIGPSHSETIYTAVSQLASLPLPCYPRSPDWSSLLKLDLKAGHWSFSPFLEVDRRGEDQRLFALSVNSTPTWEGIPSNSRANNDSRAVAEVTDKRQIDLSMIKTAIKAGDEGVYTCSLEFQNGINLRRRIELKVLRVLSSHGASIFEDQAFNLTCTLGRPLSPDLKVKWTSPHLSKASLPKDHHPTVLSIPQARKENHGKWTCTLLNGEIKLASAEIYLRIEAVPMDVRRLVFIVGGLVVFLLLLVLITIFIRRYKQRAMFRRKLRKTKYCRCKHPQPKGFYKT